MAIVVAIPLGIIQGYRRNTVDDYALTGASFVLYSFPTFWLGIILIEIFAITLHILPPFAPQGTNVGQILSDWQALVLPVTTLALVSIASYSRYMRSSMIDSLAQDYIRTAKAKGVSQRVILLRHALRNSLIPMATLIGLSIPGLLSGASSPSRCSITPVSGCCSYNRPTARTSRCCSASHWSRPLV